MLRKLRCTKTTEEVRLGEFLGECVYESSFYFRNL